MMSRHMRWKMPPGHRGSGWWTPLVLALLWTGCDQAPVASDAEPASEDPGQQVIAATDDREWSAQQVETFLQSQLTQEQRTAGTASTSEWRERYQRAAKALALESSLLAGEQDLDTALESGLEGEYPRLVCDTVLRLFLNAEPLEVEQPTIEEVEAFYEANEDAFRSPERRMVWHLFLRDRESSEGGLARERLIQLRRRALEGESFRLLVEENSDSENRQLGGQLGWIVPGRLPEDLEKIVFALPVGGISEPLSSSGGAFLVHVSDIMPGVETTEREARRFSAQRLRELNGLEALEEKVEALGASEILEQDVVFAPDELLAQLERAEAEILRIDDVKLLTSDLREMLDEHPGRGLDFVPLGDRVQEAYRLQLARQRLCRHARTSGFLDSPERQTAVEEAVRRLGAPRWVEKRLEEHIRERIEADPEALRLFFEDNRHLYQSALRLEVQGLAMPPGEDPSGSMARLEQARTRLLAGEILLEDAIEALGGTKIERYLLNPAQMAALEPKVQVYLSRTAAGSYAVPFQLNGFLQLLHVVHRHEPRPLEFEAAKPRLIRDYFKRHQQRLFVEVQDRLLAEANFELNDEALSLYLESLDLGGDEGTAQTG